MAAVFKRIGGNRLRFRLSLEEVALLQDLPEQLRALLNDQGDGPAGEGADPVARRLFPPAYLDPADAEQDAEFQRLMHDDLLRSKLDQLDLVSQTLARGSVTSRRWTVELSEEEAAAWLGVLNDVRLALGVRLDITEDFDAPVDLPGQPPELQLLAYLGWLEEHLVEALSA
jgi:hypothetical protein